MILGIDSISRLNMERQLPVTRKLLLSPPLSAVSLLGYNKVGDNTFPNLIPMLTSLDLDELTRTCWPALNKNKLDGCPFIWKKFAAAGYRTVYGEDCARFSTFNYVKTGFVEQPTDYYTRPLEYGWLEERLPLAYFSLPERFKTRFPEAAANLNLNAQRLTSPYDVHETLRDLLSMGEESRTWPEIWNNNSSNVSRGISLFAPISTNRACQDAGIDPQWCTCQLGPEVNTPLSVIQQAVNFLMSDMNKRLRTLNGSCVPLKLTKIKSWKSHELDKFDPRIASRIVQHLVTFRTNPGGGMFEATVRQIFFDLSVQPAVDFERTGTISRLNTYSRQSHCVKRLKLYCYCKDLMKS
ncbi:hypothetical protein B566_EDAN004333 [Ephemera danica]|nr:hypothetical protein B566_EDAN004333 [Ephemera danica]